MLSVLLRRWWSCVFAHALPGTLTNCCVYGVNATISWPCRFLDSSRLYCPYLQLCSFSCHLHVCNATITALMSNNFDVWPVNLMFDLSVWCLNHSSRFNVWVVGSICLTVSSMSDLSVWCPTHPLNVQLVRLSVQYLTCQRPNNWFMSMYYILCWFWLLISYPNNVMLTLIICQYHWFNIF